MPANQEEPMSQERTPTGLLVKYSCEACDYRSPYVNGHNYGCPLASWNKP